MTTMASEITSPMVVYSTVYSDVDQRKHQSSASLAFVWGIHRDRWIPRTNGQLRGKCFHLMTSSWYHESISPVYNALSYTPAWCTSWLKIIVYNLIIEAPVQYNSHRGWDKIAAISKTTFSNAFSWMKIQEFRLKFLWSLFVRVQWTIFHLWFR